MKLLSLRIPTPPLCYFTLIAIHSSSVVLYFFFKTIIIIYCYLCFILTGIHVEFSASKRSIWPFKTKDSIDRGKKKKKKKGENVRHRPCGT